MSGAGSVANAHSVILSQSNNNPMMAMTKRHGGEGANGSSKWLPSVGNDKKTRPSGGNGNTTTIQIGKGEIQITNQAHSPGPSSIKMYQSQN